MASLGNSKLRSVSSLSFMAIMVVAIIHLVGIVGLNSASYHAFFERLAGVNLLLSFLLVMVFHKPVNKRFVFFCLFAFIIGMSLEIIGVNTGYPFGSYCYTNVLGPQILGVPFIIGFNWILLSYSAAISVALYLKHWWQRVVAASVMMVGIDLLLESFAIHHHFWIWQSAGPPVQNYVAWFLISLLIQFGFVRLIPSSSNANAPRYLVILSLFLLIDLLFSSVGRTF